MKKGKQTETESIRVMRVPLQQLADGIDEIAQRDGLSIRGKADVTRCSLARSQPAIPCGDATQGSHESPQARRVRHAGGGSARVCTAPCEVCGGQGEGSSTQT